MAVKASCPMRVQELRSINIYIHTQIDQIERNGFSAVRNRFRASSLLYFPLFLSESLFLSLSQEGVSRNDED